MAASIASARWYRSLVYTFRKTESILMPFNYEKVCRSDGLKRMYSAKESKRGRSIM